MEIYDISIEPGQIRDIFCNGSYVYFYAGSAGGADATITVNQDSRGQRVLLQPGQAYRMSNGDAGTRWLIGNLRGEGTIIGRLVIGSGELTDNRVTGSVEVIDGGKNRTLSGSAFAWAGGQVAVAAQYSQAQLWNPAGSGKNAFLKAVGLTCTATGGIATFATDVQIGTTQFGPFASKNFGGTNPVLTARSGATGFTTVNAYYVEYQNIQANVTQKTVFQDPVLIKPGNGIVFESTAVNATLNYSAEWIEEPI